MHDYKKLEIWKRSFKLVKDVYEMIQAGTYPIEERFALIDQLKRAVVSIPSNIAEGCGRDTNLQTAHFICISFGSLCEVETQVLLSRDLNFMNQISSERILSEIKEIKNMTWSFKKSLVK